MMMEKQELNLPVYTITKFGASHDFFWMEDLDQAVVKHTWWQQAHRQAYFLLLFIQDARGSLLMDGQHTPINGPMVVCCKPHMVNRILLEKGAQGCVIAFSADFFSLRFNSNVLQQFRYIASPTAQLLQLQSTDQQKWSQLCALMLHEFVQAKPEYKVLRSYLNILLHAAEKALAQQGGAVDATAAKHSKVIEFQALLEQHFLESKSPSFYADKLNISLHYLNRLCKDYCQATSGQLIRDRVLMEVKRLLMHTSCSVAEIAYQLGFESPSYFNTFFKKQMGFTPESFRHLN